MRKDLTLYDNPTEDQVATCTACGRRVLAFTIAGVAYVWDPTARQRRWARGLMSARDYAVGPRWSEAFGRVHECGPRPDDLAEASAFEVNVPPLREDGGGDACLRR